LEKERDKTSVEDSVSTNAHATPLMNEGQGETQKKHSRNLNITL
jgi:hypothetical protein